MKYVLENSPFLRKHKHTQTMELPIPQASAFKMQIGNTKAVMPLPKKLTAASGCTWVELFFDKNTHTLCHRNCTDKHYSVLSGRIKVCTVSIETGKIVTTKNYSAGTSFLIPAGEVHFLVAPKDCEAKLTMWRLGDTPNADWEHGASQIPKQYQWWK